MAGWLVDVDSISSWRKRFTSGWNHPAANVVPVASTGVEAEAEANASAVHDKTTVIVLVVANGTDGDGIIIIIMPFFFIVYLCSHRNRR
jgi:hypothetical protein